MIDLNASLVLQHIQNKSPIQEQLLQIVVARYGGSTENWKIRKVANAYLVKIPVWVSQDDIYADEEYWGMHHMMVLPWQTLDGSEPATTRHRVTIVIRDFPLDFWHPTYFRQATVAIGMLIGFATDTIGEGNLARVQLLLECTETNLIPPTITIYHNDRRTICKVERANTSPQGTHRHNPPSPLDETDHSGEDLDENDNVQTHPLPPNWTHWRQREITIPLIDPDPGARIASAAQVNSSHQENHRRLVDH